MKKKLYILLIFLLTFNIGCNDGFLDTAPYDGLSTSLIFNSDANALMAMNGVYSTLANRSFEAEFFNYVTNLGPEGFDQLRAPWGMTHAMGLATARDANIQANYRNFYRPIIYANDVISGLDGNEAVSDDLRKRMIGEAKFIRGLCYFYLNNFYGGVILLDKPTPVTETYLPRNSEQQVQDFIIQNFKEAIDVLPVSYGSASDQGRVTKGAAIAMLGKTYLYQQKWDLAAAEFEKLLKAPFTYDLMADYSDNFNINTKNNKESVFELQYVEQEGLGSSFNRWYGHRSVQINGGDRAAMSSHMLKVFTKLDGSPIDFSTIPRRSSYSNDVAHGVDLTSWYIETFEDVDQRIHKSAILPGSTFVGAGNVTFKLYWPFTPYVNATPRALNTTGQADAKVLIRKFLTIGDQHTLFREDSPMNYPVIRFSDVLLMYAEARNEISGASADVYTAVNKVRARGGVVTLPDGLSKDEMRQNIRLERAKEFLFEGHLYFDLKRWRTAHTDDPVFGLNHEVLDYRFERVFYKKSFTEKDYLWPIPANEIDLNENMTQNPGW
ncbi:RagB/SusD family nutrient uptake outer membrane protein [Arundinibacter roseus]|uniref:RagB/SusD family nutrient uptake outer membrane protein n=1 Tax=Arundinibacter roseus TaxID=2070510 RepID=A0A4R4K5X4_9BACT|nr:RagB/SusD family nutrient uptake outer membrane protein [Arundinibacter roseus]TDB62703.1 RagB/SusD family nutrient uptake outer membrane protein [Arundinibacter roseus]